MAKFESEFNINDTVYHATVYWMHKPRECVTCAGQAHLTAISAIGTHKIPCPTCAGKGNDGFYEYDPLVEKLTVGSIRLDTTSKKSIFEYMCKETGVGSGTLYSESRLFHSEKEAKKQAELLAQEANIKFRAEHNFIDGCWRRKIDH